MAKEQKIYAYMQHPLLAEIAGGHKFASMPEALEHIGQIASTFKISTRQPQAKDKKSLILWIKGFQLEAGEIIAGIIGNYALIAPEPCEGGYEFKFTKLPAELKHHPQRKRIKQRQPDWGHGILRHIKNGITFDAIEKAHDFLKRLHDEYPEVSRPGANRLYIMIYSRNDNPKQPVQRYILEIEPHKSGGFFISYKLNPNKPKPKTDKSPAPEKPEKPDDKTQQGYFTSMVTARSRKKKKW